MPAPDHLHALISVLLFLLLIVAVFAGVANRLKVPYPIVLVVVGLAVSLVPHVPRVPLNPDLIFIIFLPPLIYASAWYTDWRAFRFHLVSILMLAVGLVAFTVLGVAFLADRFITALDWKSGFLLGAVVATTDAIAAGSIARSVGLPQRVSDVLDGESLVNDATGLLALEFGLALLLRDQAPTLVGGSLRFLWLAAGGIGFGLLLGYIGAFVHRRIDDGSIELVLSLITPYVCYLGAEQIKASGVLAVVVCGLFMSRRSARFFSPEARLQIVSVWKALDFILNGLVFILIGLQLPYVLAGIRQYSALTLIRYGFVFSAALILLRLVWMYPGAWIAWMIRTRLLHQNNPPPDSREVFVVGWTGMRGVLALAAAFSLPETLGNGQPFEQRNLIIFLTFSIILITLVGQGLTLPALIRRLGLAGGKGDQEEERIARRIVLHVALRHLLQARQNLAPGVDPHALDDLIDRYQHRLDAVGRHAGEHLAGLQPERASLLHETAELERSTLLRLRDEGRVSDSVLRTLERELDLTQARLAG